MQEWKFWSLLDEALPWLLSLQLLLWGRSVSPPPSWYKLTTAIILLMQLLVSLVFFLSRIANFGFSFSSSWIPWCRPNKIFCSEPEHSVRKIPKMSHLNFHLKNHPNYLWKEYCTKLDFLSVFQTLWNWEDKNKNEIRDIGLQWTLGRRAKSYLAPMKMPYAHSSNTTPIFPSSRLRTNLHF